MTAPLSCPCASVLEDIIQQRIEDTLRRLARNTPTGSLDALLAGLADPEPVRGHCSHCGGRACRRATGAWWHKDTKPCPAVGLGDARFVEEESDG